MKSAQFKSGRTEMCENGRARRGKSRIKRQEGKRRKDEVRKKIMNRKNGRNKSRKNIQQCWKVEIPNKDRRRYKCREGLRCKEKTALQRKDGSGWRNNYILLGGKNERWKKRENV